MVYGILASLTLTPLKAGLGVSGASYFRGRMSVARGCSNVSLAHFPPNELPHSLKNVYVYAGYLVMVKQEEYAVCSIRVLLGGMNEGSLPWLVRVDSEWLYRLRRNLADFGHMKNSG